ncbi:hypothetical protein IW140_005008 [Coemansia sp. RSA 1813]|nr:hypothetical protein EV178_004988 [Coemansia sp. RSA 1646]KAJ1768809.1 hypothetical protein LPJ74_004553 [Coemansia sp. RSA 1843]KAJ2087209.1 hypothetical protein IW138_005124 [Coemansia sp. RSA 986]KAJ2210974.1 hypothetical protein EV179_005857 [Coemansia sp. RSA 487]KAJ2566195.1 hypothetical protein IW140_005008 [Coemansia sp. RSA 1813]
MRFRTTEAIFAVAVCLVGTASAFPAFNTPNSVDASGNICPLLARPGLTCPRLCVRNFDDCPEALQPDSCPSGKQLCDDGTCQISCAGIENPCLCGMTAADVTTVYKACPAYAPTVTVQQYDPNIKDRQLEEACASEWKLDGNSTIGEWSADATDAIIWDVCPTPQEPRMTFVESYCVAFYAIIGAELVLYLLWHLYKSIRERNAHLLHQLCSPLPTTLVSAGESDKDSSSGAGDAKAAITQSDEVVGDEDAMLLRGFDSNKAGAALYYLALASTAGWIVLLSVIVADYYGDVKGHVAYGMLANSDTSMAVFIFVWHLGGIWMITMLACMSRIRNYFRIACPLARARVVQVEERRDEVVLMEGTHNRLTLLASRVRAALISRFGLNIAIESCPVQKAKVDDGVVSFIEHHCTRYVLGEHSGKFQCNSFALGSTHKELLHNRKGLSSSEAAGRAAQLGENFIRVAVPLFPVAMLQEVFSYFYLYQMMCMYVWFYFNYYKMALVQFGVIIVSAFIKVAIRLRSEHKIKSLAEHRSTCRVRRDHVWADLDTADLVPGDVVAVESGMEIMCDGCVLRGEIVVDESSLTGEAMPVRKLPLKDDNNIVFDADSGKMYSVYAGTRVLQCSSAAEGEDGTEILVLRTRTATDKGKLIQRILFPAKYSFVFDEQLPVALLLLLLYGGLGFALTIWLMGHDVTSWFYGVFVISEIMSPLLPAALVVGQSVAAQRLRRQRIYCVDLPRIIMAGKVRVFCFDKTGTLTKEGLEYFAVQQIDGAGRFEPEEIKMSHLPDATQVGFAACHAVTAVHGDLIGNPVDVEQFRATGWELGSEPHQGALEPAEASSLWLDTIVSPQGRRVHVIKRFEFVHARQSMSVAVLDTETGHVHVFVKGSFERLKRMAAADSVPADYDAVTARWAKEGCYVLALAHRDLGRVDDLQAVARMPREELEAQCSLVSLLLFRNQLKHDTETAIAELKDGDTRTVMITGDNALTGVYIARQCGMVGAGARVLLGDIEQADAKGGAQLVWRDTETDIEHGADELSGHELAVTAAAFDHLVATQTIRQLLLDIRIFARMTPHGKVQCVNLHMERAVTAMCGDGGNDCGALRAAHVGIALSDSEASIVSPFSSSNRSVRSCVALLREGRAGLATSLAGYKFLINYATTMSMLEIVQFYFSVIVPQAVWIMVDSFIVVGLCIAVTQAQTARRLAPSRPTARLIGVHTLASIWGQTVINYAFLFGIMGLLFRQSWFRCHEFDSRDIDTSLWWLLGDNFEAEVISIVCLFQFVNGAAVYNFGYRYRRTWLTNYILVVLYCGFMAAISVLTLANPNRFGCLFRINCGDPDSLVGLGYSRPTWSISEYNSPNGNNVLPHRFRWTLWALCVVNIVLCLAYERLVVLGPAGRFAKRWWARQHASSSRKKLYLKP